MEGDKKIDALMYPVITAIRRHVKDKDAVTDIYNRAYEALMSSMEESQILICELAKTRAQLEGGRLASENQWNELRLQYDVCYEALDQARAELAALKEANRWIPVEERLPENLQEVLFLADGDVYMGTHMKSIRQWAGDGLYWHDEDYSSITHWRYLPEPPEVSE